MRSMKRAGIFIGLACMLALLPAGCRADKAASRPYPSGERTDKLIVFVSLLPQADFVKQLGGDKVEVNVMMPPGANEHNYEPDSGQLKALSKADLYIKVGPLPFEDAWMERLTAANKDMLVVDSSAAIALIDNNPHIWLSPRLVKLQAKGITAAMVKLDPQNRDYYQQKNASFLRQLDSLDQEIAGLLQNVRGKSFLVYHPAWEYFARDYGLREIGIEKDGKEPGAGEMSRIIAYARQNHIKTVFASTQHSTRSAEAVAAELGGKVVVLDPLPADYIENMRQVAAVMARELAGQ